MDENWELIYGSPNSGVYLWVDLYWDKVFPKKRIKHEKAYFLKPMKKKVWESSIFRNYGKKNKGWKKRIKFEKFFCPKIMEKKNKILKSSLSKIMKKVS